MPINLSNFRIQDAANYLGVSSKTLRRWGKSGKLVSKRSEGGHRYYTREQLDNFRFADKTETAVFPSPLKNKDYTFALSFTVIMLCVGLGLNGGSTQHTIYDIPYTAGSSKPAVLAASDEGITPSVAGFTFAVNVPSKFSETVTFLKDIVAPNVVNSINDETGNITIDNSLVAGSGISITDRTITNSGILSLTAGTGIEVDGNKITNTYSFTPDYTQGGWTRTGTTVGLTTLTDSVTVGALTAGAVTVDSLTTGGLSLTNDLTVASGHSVMPAVDLGSDIGSSSFRFNNLWVANINSNSSQSFSGQTTFSYPPTDTTIDEASVLINPTSSIANGQLLGLGIAGYERAVIDEDGDIILGYSDATSAPASDYPLNIYGHNGTRVSFVDTSGNGYFAGNVGVGTSSPGYKLTVGSGQISAPVGSNVAPSYTFSGVESRAGLYKFSTGAWEGVQVGEALRIGNSGSAGAGSPQLILNNSTTSTGLFGAGNVIGFSIAGSEAMRVHSTGNVGIGTTNPLAKIDITNDVGVAPYYLAEGLRVSRTTTSINAGFGLDFAGANYGAALSYNGQKIFVADSNNGILIGANYMNANAPANGAIIEGNVGIGTTAPAYKLDVNGTAKVSGTLTIGTNGLLQYSSGRLELASGSGGQIAFYTDSAEKLRIGTNGNVGIGTTAPTSNLHVSDSTLGGTGPVSIYDGFYGYGIGYGTYANPNNNGVQIYRNTSTTYYENTSGGHVFKVSPSGSSEVMRIDSSGNVGIGTTSPGANLTVKGSGASGLTKTFSLVDSSNAEKLFIDDYGRLTAVQVTATYNTGFALSGSVGTINSSASGIQYSIARDYTAGHQFKTISNIITANDSVLLSTPAVFAPTSGTGLYTNLLLNPTINQTGGASGISRGLYINPTLTSASNWRAIEVATGNVLLGTTSGNVGIGTTSPGYKLEVNGTGYFGSTISQAAGSGDKLLLAGSTNYSKIATDASWGLNFYAGPRTVSDAGYITFNVAKVAGWSEAMRIDNSSNVTVSSLTTGAVYSNSGVLTNTDPSDINLKTNVLNLPDGTLDKVLGLRTVSYNWKSTGDGALGFVAQEVQQVFPELVGTNNDGTLGLYTTQFIPLLTKAMQEQQLEVNKQKTKLDEFIAYIESIVNGFKDKFVTKQSIQEELCVGTEGNKTCLNKEKIDVILNNLPSPTSTVAPTDLPVATPLPSSTPDPSPSTSPSASPDPSPSVEILD